VKPQRLTTIQDTVQALAIVANGDIANHHRNPRVVIMLQLFKNRITSFLAIEGPRAGVQSSR